MAGNYTRSQAELSAGAKTQKKKSGAGGLGGAIGRQVGQIAKNSSQGNRSNDAAYLAALQEMLYGGQQGGGGGGGSTRRGGGGGGGGGGGISAYDQFRIDEEKRRQAELDRRKLELTQGLQGARKQALPQLQKYSQQYNKDIGNVFAQNRNLNAGYNRQLSGIAGQMTSGANQQQALLRRDLQGQGAGASDLRAMEAAAGQNVQGANFMNQNAQMYNTRLAQMMAMAQADAGSMGAAINASSKGNLENSYAQLLAQIGMIGLQ